MRPATLSRPRGMAEAYLFSRMKVLLTRNRPTRIEAIEIARGRIFTRVLQPSGELEYTGARAANHARPHRPSVGSAAGEPARRGSQQVARDDELLDLARPLVDAQRADLA